MNIKNKKIKILIVIALFTLFNIVNYVEAVEAKENVLEFVMEKELAIDRNRKVAYITFDDGPSIYTEKLLDVLNHYEVPGIFFVLGHHLEIMPNSDRILNRIMDDGHYIALHTMTHDKTALYQTEKSPTTFTEEMLELRDEIEARTGHIANLCRAPYGKRGYFKTAHYQVVKEAGLYCIDWHLDSRDWVNQNAGQIYNEVVKGVKQLEDNQEIVLLFHEFQRTVDALPDIIEFLKEEGYTFEPYVEGKIFEDLE